MRSIHHQRQYHRERILRDVFSAATLRRILIQGFTQQEHRATECDTGSLVMIGGVMSLSLSTQRSIAPLENKK